MPAEFEFPLSNEIWTPLEMRAGDEHERAERKLQVIGLLRPGVMAVQAQAEAQEISRGLEGQYPNTNRGRGLRVVPILDATNKVTDAFFFCCWMRRRWCCCCVCERDEPAAGAGGEARERDCGESGTGREPLSDCQAVNGGKRINGAGGRRVRAVSGELGPGFFEGANPGRGFVSGLRTMRIDSTVIAYTFAISIVAGLLAFVPAILRLVGPRSLTDLNEALQAGGRTAGAASSAGRSRLQATLIASEVALALVLLIGATLTVKAFRGVMTGAYGYEAKNLLRLQVSLPGVKYGAVVPKAHRYWPNSNAIGQKIKLGGADSPWVTVVGVFRRYSSELAVKYSSAFYLFAVHAVAFGGGHANDSNGWRSAVAGAGCSGWGEGDR